MIDPLSTWISTFAALPTTADTSWAGNFANWANDRVIDMELSGILNAGLDWTFNKTTFEASLIVLTPTPIAASGIASFASAWETAIVASALSILAGASLGAPSPATTWSVVSSQVIDSSGIAAGKAKILELVSSPPVPDATSSDFPVKFREAFLLLTGSITGLNSVIPPTGPNPLVSPFTSFT